MSQKKYKIEYLPVADRDLTEIFAYIASDLAAPQAAVNLLQKIDYAVKSLETFPYGTVTAPFEFRALVVASYLVFYYVTENAVTIARVVYGRRDIGNVL